MNEEMRKCCDISSTIVEYYDELNKIITVKGFDDPEVHFIIEKIRGAVLKESEQYSKLDCNKVTAVLPACIASVDKDSLNTNQRRIFDNLVSVASANRDKCTVVEQILRMLNIECPSKNITLEDMLLSMINTAILAKVETEMKAMINYSWYNDGFIKGLCDNHNTIKISVLSDNKFSELLALNHSFDIFSFPINDLSCLIDCSSIENKLAVREGLKILCMNIILALLDELSTLTVSYKDVNIIYRYKYLLAAFEVCLSYIDKKQFEMLNEHINNMNISNMNVRRKTNLLLLKKRMKDSI